MVLSIGQAAQILGVVVSTLRRWEQEERLLPAFRTMGGHRRYQLCELEVLIAGAKQAAFEKKDLNRLLRLLCRGQVQRLVLTHRDRLLRFGSPLLFKICAFYGTEVVVLDESKQKTFEEELVKDVIELMTVFAARVHGKCSQSQKKKVAHARVA